MNYKVNTKNFKTRKENNGTFSFMDLKTMKIMFLNKIASFIYSNPQINNLEMLVKEICDRYEGAAIEEVYNDCSNILNKMNVLNIIDITEEKDKNDRSIRLAGEKDFKKLSKFMQNRLQRKGEAIICSSPNVNDFNAYNIRVKQFNNLEYNIIYVNDNADIINSITLGVGASPSVFTLSNLIAKKEDINIIKLLIKYAFDITEQLKKIRVTLRKDESAEEVISMLEKLGFNLEAELKKEYNELSLLSYSLFREDI